MINKKVIICLLSLMLLSTFVLSNINFASALESVTEPVKGMFTDWLDGKINHALAKWLFFILILIFVWSIISKIPFVKDTNSWAKIGVATVIAFLASAYLGTEEVILALTAYNAMGIVLMFIAPLIILVLLSYQLSTSTDMGAGGKILSKLLWIGFIIFLFARMIYAFIKDQLGGTYLIAGLVVIVFALLWVKWGENYIFTKMELEGYDSDVKASLQDALDSEIFHRDEALKQLGAARSDPSRERAQAKIDRADKTINNLKARLSKGIFD